MSDGAKQFMAWTMAFGLSATVYGGGAFWLKKTSAHQDHGSHADQASAHESKGTHSNDAGVHGNAHDAPIAHDEHGNDHGTASAHDSAHEAKKHQSTVHASKDSQHDEHKTETAMRGDHHASSDEGDNSHQEKADKHAEVKDAHAADKDKHAAPHWSYLKNDAGGPSHWGDLARNFAMCEKGREQSPIDIGRASSSKIAPKLEWDYGAASLQIENNGHTIQSNIVGEKFGIKIDGESFKLAQFHFHAPSEHRISGIPSDMELHFVHKNASGGLAVVGVMINELAGRENKFFKPIWDVLPRDFHTKVQNPVTVALESLMPAGRQYFHYQGSLTTPPCSEGVRWFVLKDPVTMSSGQIEMYTSVFHGPTNRPVQPLQGREIITNGTPSLAH